MALNGGKQSKTAGLPPGTLVHVGEKLTEKVRICVLDYDEERFEEREAVTPADCAPYRKEKTITWINVDGIHDPKVIERLGGDFQLHPLTQEDILNTQQRPKIEDFGHYLFCVLKMLYYDPDADRVSAEQVSLVLTENCVISFQEQQGDVFNMIRERLRSSTGRIRRMGADYLAYALADAIVDNCFAILETVGERVEKIEEVLTRQPSPHTLRQIHSLKRELIMMRKAMWPLREVVSGMLRRDSALIHETTEVFLRDLYDHIVQVIDTIETHRDMVSGMLDTYLSVMSNRMNEVMKVLTIIATIFIPLTFVAGIYGMNFKYMPETDWRPGYPVVLGVMALIAVAMLIYFRRKDWL